jgi:PilZ domain
LFQFDQSLLPQLSLKRREQSNCAISKHSVRFCAGTGHATTVKTRENMMELYDNLASVGLEEKRGATRQKAFTAAHVHFNRGTSTYEALVRNISATGAKLKFGELIELPTEFQIKVGATGNYHTAHVAWRHGFEIGVEFTA